MNRREQVEGEVTEALCNAIRDRGNEFLAQGSTIEQVVEWARQHGPTFARIREDAIALAMATKPTCTCEAHRG
jgi:hypothetical protein